MADINQKIPFAQSLNSFTERKVAESAWGNQSLPCHVVSVSGSIVTVAFDVLSGKITMPQVTMPVFGPEYIRYPIQVGDKGYAMSATASLRGQSGLGTGVADFTDPGNLTSLVFMPIGNKNWFTVDGNILFMYGINGVEITTKNQDVTLLLNHSGITINLGGGNLIINNGNTTMNGNLTVNGLITGTNGFAISGGSGGTMNVTGNIATTGTITNNGKNIGSTHTHSGVTTGSGNTGVPT